MDSTELTIKQVFQNPHTGAVFPTKRGAEISVAKFIAKQKAEEESRQKQKEAAAIKQANHNKTVNYLRLNLEDIKDLPAMLKEGGKALGLDIKAKFDIHFTDGIRPSHDSPVGTVTDWYDKKGLRLKGFSGNATISAKSNKNRVKNDRYNESLADELRRNFVGLHFGTGCPGSVDNHTLSIGFHIYLDDFPKLKAKYEIFFKGETVAAEHGSLLAELHAEATNYAETSALVKNLNSKIRTLSDIREEKLAQFVAAYKKSYPVAKPVFPDGYLETKKMFS